MVLYDLICMRSVVTGVILVLVLQGDTQCFAEVAEHPGSSFPMTSKRVLVDLIAFHSQFQPTVRIFKQSDVFQLDRSSFVSINWPSRLTRALTENLNGRRQP